MSDNAFDLNRPVHLARRDVFYEQAAILIRQLSSLKNKEQEKKIADRALRLFCKAREHALIASRSGHSSTEDHLFLEFLNATVDNTQSITRMLHRQQSVESKNSAIERFLGTADVSTKMSTHCRRCAAHILKGLVLLLQNATQPYEQLKKDMLAKMSLADKARYDKARTYLSDMRQP